MPADVSPQIVVVPIVAGIGNALMAVPLVQALKRRDPDGKVIILARTKPMAEVFRRLPEADDVIVTGGGLKNLLKQIKFTRGLRADAYVIPFPSNRWQYALLALTSGAKRKILHRYPVGTILALGFLKFDRVDAVRGIHDVEQNLRLLENLPGWDGAELSATGAFSTAAVPPHPCPLQQGREGGRGPVFSIVEPDRAHAATLLDACGLAPTEPFILVHAGSAQTVLAQAKRWPPQNYARLIDALHAETGHAVVLVEGPDEAGVAAQITGHAKRYVPHVLPLCGPLGDAGALLEKAVLYVGSDSGLAHLAAAVGTRTVTLFAPADPDRVCPYGNRDLVVQTPATCSPCFLYPWDATRPAMKCAPPFCIEQISVQSVVERAKTALGLSRGPIV